MGGGELELALAGGQMNEYLTGGSTVQPRITFFKSVYQKYHNFAQESISLPFDKSIQWMSKESVLTCHVKRYGQLLHKMCVTFTLPSLKHVTHNGSLYQAKWAPYVGLALIKHAELFIGGQKLQTITGEWIHTHYNMYSDSNESRAFEHLVGHVDDLIGSREPAIAADGESTNDAQRTTPERTIHVPLPFICDESATTIPLVALQSAKVEVRITFRPLQEVLLVRKRAIIP
jgi:hypothetical protein